jgi:hypothetical protein
MMEVELVTGDSVQELEERVQHKLPRWDLQGTVVVTHRILLGQWMVRKPAGHEYRLIEARNFRELEQQVRSLAAEDWTYWCGTVGWNGRMLQWMRRAPRDTALVYVPIEQAEMVEV